MAQAAVDDATGRLLHTYIGPQVAWKMARGYDGAFGARSTTGLDLARPVRRVPGRARRLRRPLSLRTLDLLVLLSFSLSLAYFNQGNIFLSVPLPTRR